MKTKADREEALNELMRTGVVATAALKKLVDSHDKSATEAKCLAYLIEAPSFRRDVPVPTLEEIGGKATNRVLVMPSLVASSLSALDVVHVWKANVKLIVAMVKHSLPMVKHSLPMLKEADQDALWHLLGTQDALWKSGKQSVLAFTQELASALALCLSRVERPTYESGNSNVLRMLRRCLSSLPSLVDEYGKKGGKIQARDLLVGALGVLANAMEPFRVMTEAPTWPRDQLMPDDERKTVLAAFLEATKHSSTSTNFNELPLAVAWLRSRGWELEDEEDAARVKARLADRELRGWAELRLVLPLGWAMWHSPEPREPDEGLAQERRKMHVRAWNALAWYLSGGPRAATRSALGLGMGLRLVARERDPEIAGQLLDKVLPAAIEARLASCDCSVVISPRCAAALASPAKAAQDDAFEEAQALFNDIARACVAPPDTLLPCLFALWESALLCLGGAVACAPATLVALMRPLEDMAPGALPAMQRDAVVRTLFKAGQPNEHALCETDARRAADCARDRRDVRFRRLFRNADAEGDASRARPRQEALAQRVCLWPRFMERLRGKWMLATSLRVILRQLYPGPEETSAALRALEACGQLTIEQLAGSQKVDSCDLARLPVQWLLDLDGDGRRDGNRSGTAVTLTPAAGRPDADRDKMVGRVWARLLLARGRPLHAELLPIRKLLLRLPQGALLALLRKDAQGLFARAALAAMDLPALQNDDVKLPCHVLVDIAQTAPLQLARAIEVTNPLEPNLLWATSGGTEDWAAATLAAADKNEAATREIASSLLRLLPVTGSVGRAVLCGTALLDQVAPRLGLAEVLASHEPLALRALVFSRKAPADAAALLREATALRIDQLWNMLALMQQPPRPSVLRESVSIGGSTVSLSALRACGKVVGDAEIMFAMSRLRRALAPAVLRELHTFDAAIFLRIKEGQKLSIVASASANELLRKKIWVVPVNYDLHWSLAVIMDVDNWQLLLTDDQQPQQQRQHARRPFIAVLDSTAQQHHKHAAEVAPVLENMLKAVLVIAGKLTVTSRNDAGVAQMQVFSPVVPLQLAHSNDCALFVIRFYAQLLQWLSSDLNAGGGRGAGTNLSPLAVDGLRNKLQQPAAYWFNPNLVHSRPPAVVGNGDDRSRELDLPQGVRAWVLHQVETLCAAEPQKHGLGAEVDTGALTALVNSAAQAQSRDALDFWQHLAESELLQSCRSLPAYLVRASAAIRQLPMQAVSEVLRSRLPSSLTLPERVELVDSAILSVLETKVPLDEQEREMLEVALGCIDQVANATTQLSQPVRQRLRKAMVQFPRVHFPRIRRMLEVVVDDAGAGVVGDGEAAGGKRVATDVLGLDPSPKRPRGPAPEPTPDRGPAPEPAPERSQVQLVLRSLGYDDLASDLRAFEVRLASEPDAVAQLREAAASALRRAWAILQ